VTVGEANGVTADNALLWVAEATEHDQGGVFNMIFSLNT
jgi:alpha-glucosidase